MNGVSGYRAHTIREFITATKQAMELHRGAVKIYAEKFLMENVNEKFQTWWDHLYTINFKTQRKWYN